VPPFVFTSKPLSSNSVFSNSKSLVAQTSLAANDNLIFALQLEIPAMLKEFLVTFQLIPAATSAAAVAGVQAVPEATIGLVTSVTLIT
jgi:siroheme synthase